MIQFEGEYLNGKKWNGNGYYSNGEIYKLVNGKGFLKEQTNLFELYEGEYLNWERNGKGKEYNSINGRLVFEGEYLKGKRWTGKEYDDKGNIICELYKGKGLVKDFSISNIKYKGEYFNGKRHGKGKEYEINQLIYEGEYYNGKRNGKGKEYNINGKLLFKGEFCNNHIRKGKEFNEGILVFEGEFIHER